MPRSLYIKLPGSELFRSSFRCDCGHESDFSEIFDLPNIEQIRRLLMVELRGLRRDFEVEGTRIAGLFKGMNHGDIERVLRRAAKDMVLSGAGFLNERHIQAAVQRAVQAGIPPDWNDIPAEFQADAAALERMDDNSLWRIARARQTPSDFTRYQELLDKNRNGTISDSERNELNELRVESDRFMICKAHAAALLRWRGHRMPPPEKL